MVTRSLPFDTGVGKLRRSRPIAVPLRPGALRAPGRADRAGRRLSRRLQGSRVLLLHQLAVPGSELTVDHLAVGPGGITVIVSEPAAGRARVSDGRLLIGGEDRSEVIAGVLARVEAVTAALANAGIARAEVAGALCWDSAEATVPWRALSLDGVLIDGASGVAKLARRRGSMRSQDVELAAATLRAG